jgi:hypothetical protein
MLIMVALGFGENGDAVPPDPAHGRQLAARAG